MKPITISSLAAALLFSTLAVAAHAADASGAARPLTRAEVRADLEAWTRAGLAEYWRGDRGPDVNSAEYQRRFAVYESLRAAQGDAAAR
ncbi:DUF4148 domain-containing protein [Cupriavidus sp. DF5525]|uniref:DUF4148 domain-containing protein n=1 Tax=Cupriavidus sp. DF5525 TaxID=3160989 RepID=UPI0003B0E1E5|nr:hypothetical protein N234_22965 [Ralstonia pickettii DTP0602]